MIILLFKNVLRNIFFCKNLFFYSISISALIFFSLYKMIHRSLWLDELYMLAVAKMDFISSIQQTFDYSAPLYQILLKLLVKIGFDSEIVLRFPSLVFSLLSLIYVYLLAKLIFNQKTAVVTTLLTSVHPFVVYYSSESRPYTLLLLLSCASCYYYLKCIDLKTHKNYLLYATFTILMPLGHYYGYLVFAAQLCHLIIFYLIKSLNNKEFIPSFLITFLILLILSIFPIRYVLEGLPAASWMQPPTLYSWELGDFFRSSRFLVLCAIFIALVCSLINIVNRVMYRKNLSKEACGFLFLFLWIVFGVYSILLYSAVIKPLYTERHFVFIIPACIILLSYFITRLYPVVSLSIIISIFALFLLIDWQRCLFIPRKGFPELVSFLNELEVSKCFIIDKPYGSFYKSPNITGLQYYSFDGKIEPFTIPNHSPLRTAPDGFYLVYEAKQNDFLHYLNSYKTHFVQMPFETSILFYVTSGP